MFKKNIFTTAVIFVATLCLLVFVLFLFQKPTYITANLFVTGGEWWWGTPSPPYWLGSPVSRGAIEYDIKGRKLVEVLSVEKFEEVGRTSMILQVRLLISKNVLTKKYRFKQNPLEIGTTISISPGSVQLYANVTGIEGVQLLGNAEKQRVVVRLFNVFPWQADAIHVGDVMKSGSEEVAKVLTKEVVAAEKTIVTESTQLSYDAPGKRSGQLVLLRSDPLRRDVTMEMEIAVRTVNNQRYFGFTQTVKVGEYVYISLPSIFINPVIISLSPLSP
ncbi:MAG: hypothetical protein WAV51_04760 [Microgenomates group bacterium]